MFDFLLAVLAFGTIAVFLFLGYRGAKRTNTANADDAPSTLAADGPDSYRTQS